MKVTLINYTQEAAELLIFTKATRLTMSPGLLDEIRGWPEERKLHELEYMAGTIPSSWEFCNYTFLIEGVSRAFTHQFVRSRHASFAQQSMRVVGMSDYDFVLPERFKQRQEVVGVVTDTNEFIKESYKRLTQKYGMAAEDARSILPTNIATNIVAMFNLRSFSEMARSRTGGRTQDEYRQVAGAMVTEVLAVHPWAEKFIFKQDRHFFDEIEAFAERKFAGDLIAKGELLKIVDAMRKDGNSGNS